MAQWNIDTTHSSADFTVRHMMVTNVRGSFSNIDGVINFDPANPAASSVDVTIDVNSINTGVNDRDNHLRSGDFFDIATYPNITFKSTNVEVTGDDSAKVTGDLTIRDVTKTVVLDVDFLGQGGSPFGDTRAGFEATTKIDREAFGLTWNQALEAGGVLVGKDIKIVLDVQGVLVTETTNA
ncbi:MAG: YceI family protein [Phototrophicaceae bacterium]